METINYDITSGNELVIGRKFDHKINYVQFEGFSLKKADSAVYIKIDKLGLYPLYELGFEVSHEFTQRTGLIACQLMEIAKDNELIQNSNIFYLKVLPSLNETVEIYEDEPKYELWFAKFAELYEDVKLDRESGAFKGDKGDDYVLKEEDKDYIASLSAIKVQPTITQINNSIINLGSTKVDKVDGKALSTNDFTDEYKNQITVNKNDIESLSEDFDSLGIELDNLTVNKQEKLIPGDNITIVNNVISSEVSKNYVDAIKLELINEIEDIDDALGNNYYTKEAVNTLLNDKVSSGEVLALQTTLAQQINTKLSQDDFNNSKFNYVKDAIVNNDNTLTDEEQLKIEEWLGLSDTYLTYYNTMPYNVNTQYQPANKKYVDDSLERKFIVLTQSEYDNLTNKSESTFYFIKE